MLRHLALANALRAIGVCWGSAWTVAFSSFLSDTRAWITTNFCSLSRTRYGRRNRLSSPSGPPCHGPKLRIATGKVSKASEPSSDEHGSEDRHHGPRSGGLRPKRPGHVDADGDHRPHARATCHASRRAGRLHRRLARGG